MKNSLFHIASFFVIPLVSIGQQQTDSIKIIQLEEVVVSDKPKPKKLKHFKTDGFPPSYQNLNQNDKFINLIKGYPRGKLHYVEFYFNTGLQNMFKKKLKINYQDVEVQLLIYSVKDDSLIGNSLLPHDVKFIVGKNHDGAFRISLSEFNIREEQIFIGISVVGKTKKGEANLYVRMNENKDAIGFYQNRYSQTWNKISLPFKEVFKLKLGIE